MPFCREISRAKRDKPGSSLVILLSFIAISAENWRPIRGRLMSPRRSLPASFGLGPSLAQHSMSMCSSTYCGLPRSRLDRAIISFPVSSRAVSACSSIGNFDAIGSVGPTTVVPLSAIGVDVRSPEIYPCLEAVSRRRGGSKVVYRGRSISVLLLGLDERVQDELSSRLGIGFLTVRLFFMPRVVISPSHFDGPPTRWILSQSQWEHSRWVRHPCS